MRGAMIRTILLTACAATLLAGCTSTMGAPAGGEGPPPLTPTQRFALLVEPGMERIALAVHETGMSANQDAALRDLVASYLSQGGPGLLIQAPSGGDPVSTRFAHSVAERLNAMGAAGRFQVVAYEAPDPRAPVLVGYETLTAVVPQCGTNWGNLTRTARNETSANFGCAVTANLAAQIANPRDIVTPRAMPPVDSGRRAVVLDRYRRGTQTSAPQEELVGASRVSDAVN